MKKLCLTCKNFRANSKSLSCSLRPTTSNEYGTFDCGASCVHDGLLLDRFELNTEIPLQQLQNSLLRKEKECASLQYKVSKLEISIDKLTGAYIGEDE